MNLAQIKNHILDDKLLIKSPDAKNILKHLIH